MEIKKFENSLIAFDFEKEMVNATDMAKKFGKRPNDFLQIDATKAFIKELESDTTVTCNVDFQAVVTVKGGNISKISQGTWMHRLLAYKFAAWLSPKFELFVYKTFDETIQTKLKNQQRQLDYFWDREDQKDLYPKY